ncbi:putative ribonuclease H-like domain-containing protein [Tanacetum coccineum]|uniref:Ribonuclease H-like domain-containing protein n=1 Tax=Tanacetum coccineum TaxID=301880 RepID=A0ABQ5H9C3_9ASTR
MSINSLRFLEDPAHPNKVYRVVKALYGLHQAPRAWYERLSTFLLKHGYRRGAIDKTLFIKKDRRDIMLGGIVDDIILEIYQISKSLQRFHLNGCSKGSLVTYAWGQLKIGRSVGGCQYLGRRLGSWPMQRNNTIVAIFSTDAEYVAAKVLCSGLQSSARDAQGSPTQSACSFSSTASVHRYLDPSIVMLSHMIPDQFKDEGNFVPRQEHNVQEEDYAHPFFDDIVDKDAAVTPDLERKSDETEEVNIEEKEASNVKSGETEELDLEQLKVC